MNIVVDLMVWGGEAPAAMHVLPGGVMDAPWTPALIADGRGSKELRFVLAAANGSLTTSGSQPLIGPPRLGVPGRISHN